MRTDVKRGRSMKAEFTAIIEVAPEGGYWAICPEIPGANGQGESPEEAKESLREAIELFLLDRKEDILRGLPDDVILETVLVG
jgi:predicted RNase H-like HicB family nuclease